VSPGGPQSAIFSLGGRGNVISTHRKGENGGEVGPYLSNPRATIHWVQRRKTRPESCKHGGAEHPKAVWRLNAAGQKKKYQYTRGGRRKKIPQTEIRGASPGCGSLLLVTPLSPIQGEGNKDAQKVKGRDRSCIYPEKNFVKGAEPSDHNIYHSGGAERGLLS